MSSAQRRSLARLRKAVAKLFFLTIDVPAASYLVAAHSGSSSAFALAEARRAGRSLRRASLMPSRTPHRITRYRTYRPINVPMTDSTMPAKNSFVISIWKSCTLMAYLSAPLIGLSEILSQRGSHCAVAAPASSWRNIPVSASRSPPLARLTAVCLPPMLIVNVLLSDGPAFCPSARRLSPAATRRA